jgi:hypothetical protein
MLLFLNLVYWYFERTPWTEIWSIARHVHTQKYIRLFSKLWDESEPTIPVSEKLTWHNCGHVRVPLVYVCIIQSELSFILPLELSYSLPRMCNRSRPFRLLCDTIQYFNNVSQAGYCNRKQETRAGKQEVMLHCMFVIPTSSSHLHTVERSC